MIPTHSLLSSISHDKEIGQIYPGHTISVVYLHRHLPGRVCGQWGCILMLANN